MAKLHFYYSAMNAGKSTTLLQSSHNYKERGMDTLVFTPAIDDRYGMGKVTSRIGISTDAIIFGGDTDIFTEVEDRVKKNKKIGCVLIDEAHFLSQSQVWALCQITDDLNLPVLAYGLRSGYLAEPFEGSKYLLALADNLIEIKTICHCGRKATMSLRVDEMGHAVREGASQIHIGGNDHYVATCRHHFRLGQGKPFEKGKVLGKLSLISSG